MKVEKFVHFIYRLEKLFILNFDEFCTEENIQRLFDIMKTIEFDHPCEKFPLIYIIKLFIRLKIFYALKFTKNKDLYSRKKSDRTNRKVTILSHL